MGAVSKVGAVIGEWGGREPVFVSPPGARPGASLDTLFYGSVCHSPNREIGALHLQRLC